MGFSVGSSEGGHVESLAGFGPPRLDGSPSSGCPAVAVHGCEAGESGSLFAIEGSEFGEGDEQGDGDGWADPDGFPEDGAFAFRLDVFLDVVVDSGPIGFDAFSQGGDLAIDFGADLGVVVEFE